MLEDKKSFFKSKKGFTLIEVLIASSLTALILIIGSQALLSYNNNTIMLEAQNQLKSYDQKGVNDIGRIIGSSKVIFGRINPSDLSAGVYDITSQYINMISLPTNFTVNKNNYVPLSMSSRVLPIIYKDMPTSTSYLNDPVTPFIPDAVGNSLLVGSYEDSCNINIPGRGITRILDLYQFHYFFIAKTTNEKDSSGMQYLNLVDLRSKYYLDYEQIKSLYDQLKSITGSDSTAKLELSQALLNAKAINTPIDIKGIWNYNNKVACSNDTTFTGTSYFYDFSGNSIKNYSCSDYKIINDRVASPFLNIGREGKIFYNMSRNNIIKTSLRPVGYSISNTPMTQRVPIYANVDSSLNGSSVTDAYPNGFEVMVTGRTSARKVTLRTVRRASTNQRSIFNESFAVFQGRDN